MGITTIISCDRCGKVLADDEDVTAINCRLETDRNEISHADVRKNKGGVYCEPCGDATWEKISAAVAEQLGSGIPEPAS